MWAVHLSALEASLDVGVGGGGDKTHVKGAEPQMGGIKAWEMARHER